MGGKSDHVATLPVFCGIGRHIIYALNKEFYFNNNTSIMHFIF